MTSERDTLLSLPGAGSPHNRCRRVVHNNSLIIIFLEHFVAHFYLQHIPESLILRSILAPLGWLLIRISGGLLALFVGPW